MTTREIIQTEELYSRLIAKKVFFILTALGGLVALVLVAASLGSARLGIGEVARAIGARLLPLNVTVSDKVEVIVWDIRLPRIVLGVLAGAGLAFSGTAMQGIMRNPLVSPYTIGIASAAAFGASVAIILGAGLIGSGKYIVITNAFIFALLNAVLVYGLARIRGMRSETLILAGIALMYLFSACTSVLQYIATEEELHAVVHWLFGSLTGASWENIRVLLPVLVVCFLPLMKYSWDLNAMLAGDETAASLGVNVERVRTIILIFSTLPAATIICFTGIIGFVGLVAPHITRMLIGADHRFLLPSSSVLGALLLLGADTVGRTAFQPTVIPVGIVVSFIGVPFFLYLILRGRREYFR
ncbi:iron ABC transporter permease [Candidatus Poribacteria bacterium]|nr:iron ABC transporter permease [Candidatus Poribacteria bacterium]